VNAAETPRLRTDTQLRRAVDLAVAVPLLLLLLPLLVVVAALIVADSRGPALYRQERVGRCGRPFQIIKFRSMVADASALGPAVSGHDDPRITRVGAVLRRTKLDELPQLYNVVRGDMTLIGPRAEVSRYVAYYTDAERELLATRPGLTGPGQVYFTEHQADELDVVADPDHHYVEHQLHAKLAIDLDYVRNRSLLRDFDVLARTLWLIVPGLTSVPSRPG